MYKWSNSDYFSELDNRFKTYREDMDEPYTKFFYEFENIFEDFVLQKKQNLDQDFAFFVQDDFYNVISIKPDHNDDVLEIVCNALYKDELLEQQSKEQAEADFYDLVYQFEDKADRGIYD